MLEFMSYFLKSKYAAHESPSVSLAYILASTTFPSERAIEVLFDDKTHVEPTHSRSIWEASVTLVTFHIYDCHKELPGSACDFSVVVSFC